MIRSRLAVYFRRGHHRIRHGHRHLRLILRPAAPVLAPEPPTWDEVTDLLPIIAAQLAHTTHENWQPAPRREGRHALIRPAVAQ